MRDRLKAHFKEGDIKYIDPSGRAGGGGLALCGAGGRRSKRQHSKRGSTPPQPPTAPRAHAAAAAAASAPAPRLLHPVRSRGAARAPGRGEGRKRAVCGAKRQAAAPPPGRALTRLPGPISTLAIPQLHPHHLQRPDLLQDPGAQRGARRLRGLHRRHGGCLEGPGGGGCGPGGLGWGARTLMLGLHKPGKAAAPPPAPAPLPLPPGRPRQHALREWPPGHGAGPRRQPRVRCLWPQHAAHNSTPAPPP
jgi:hypothetical protein